MRLNLSVFVFVATFASLASSITAYADAQLASQLGQELKPIVSILTGVSKSYDLNVLITAPIDGKAQEIEVKLTLLNNGDYEFSATQKDYSLFLQRTENQTVFALPHHQVAFIGDGPVTGNENLKAAGILQRLISIDSGLSQQAKLISVTNHQSLGLLLSTLIKTEHDSATDKWSFDRKFLALFTEEGRCCQINSDSIVKGHSVKLDYEISGVKDSKKFNDSSFSTFRRVEIPRTEIERQLVRGVSRATEILAPAPKLLLPKQSDRTTEHGKLFWLDGQRVCVLSGTPDQIGQAHGQLLKEEALKTIDSVLFTFGTVNTIRTGTWFHHDLEAAYQRLAPHIPEDHKTETAALAVALGIDEELAQTINVFPELFHCSGFAVFRSATKDGKLYHGRVLDYMTTIGLQDAATNFIISVDGKIPFANVGYAGFIGSVTGMNNEAISLGEMGGHGEGQWDGVPMATLMRRALEECSTLQEVKTLWTTSPRTCEYYYVFADGKTNQAVGVAATPDTIEFIEPGQSHERLGTGIPDSVVLSAGSRLEKLRERVSEKHGEIDLETAIWLMSRPVAMKSNLHNALFVPIDGVLYVANADHDHPAAERPYVKIDLRALLRNSQRNQSVSSEAPAASSLR